MKTCNGWKSDRVKFSDVTRQTIIEELSCFRSKFQTDYEKQIGHTGGLDIGYRFNSDDNIIVTIESSVSEDNFLDSPSAWIISALKNCAERDYYYKYEKNWE
jgi:hypothetical protein